MSSNTISRRDFLGAAAAVAAAARFLPAQSAQGGAGTAVRPVIISSANGLRATEKAAAMILEGADALDAVVAGVNIIELDPTDQSVGYGGIPNEDGVVELDAAVMHGPTHRAGAVAALRNIKTPSQVARLVMQRTDHVLLVGEGALRFARAHGFTEEDLLTPESRREWLKWKESLSNDDDWLAPESGDGRQSSRSSKMDRRYGTIHCSAVDAGGNVSCVTTTSGLGFKIPGRVGDSPLIGAGLYVDNEVGSAGSTGRGEAVIAECGSHTVVELMRQGQSPEEACLNVLKRITDHNRQKRLQKPDGKPDFDVKFYAVAKDGRYGSAGMWSGAKFAVYTGGQNRLEECAYLFETSQK